MATDSNIITGMGINYNTNCRPQKSALDSTIPYIYEAIDMLNISSSSNPLMIADFGTAHGLNSIHGMKLIIQYLKNTKKIEDKKSILVIHNDLPTNDWKILFDLLQKDGSYNAVASGRSFYEQCLPLNTLSIAFSSTSLHWLSQKPCNILNHCAVNLSQNTTEREAFKHQSKLDLALFLKHRSAELVSNGVLILNIPSMNNDGSLGFDFGLHLFYECAKIIGLTEQELLDYTLPIYYRSFSDCIDTELFEQYSLKLIKAEFHKFDFDAFNQYQNGQISLHQYGQIATLVMRNWSESSLKQTLENNGRSKDGIEKMLTQFWTIYGQKITEDPQHYSVCFYYSYLIFKKL